MEPEARYTLVGTSVLILLALLTAAVVWLVASGQGKDVQTYKIYFAKQSLEGLQNRSDVKMRGIRVGTVTHISFSTRRQGTVEVVVAVAPTTPVRESTQAVVDRNLITGLATIRLVNLTEDSPPLNGPPPGEDEAVIAEGASRRTPTRRCSGSTRPCRHRTRRPSPRRSTRCGCSRRAPTR